MIEQHAGAAEAPDQQADREAPGTAPLRPRETAPLPAIEQAEDGGTRQLGASRLPSPTALRSSRQLAVAAQRDIGRVRQINQDSVMALLTFVPRESGSVPLGLFVVADGMGGHEGGEVASRLAVRSVTHYVLEHLLLPALDEQFGEALQPLMIAAVQEANATIYAQGAAFNIDMGTTCTAALLLGNAIYVAHIGDSRLYVRTASTLVQATEDHSTVGRLIKLGQLSPAESREHPLRSQLYRTVGQQPQVVVDFIYQPLGEATHLLLCSDGLWSMVEDTILDEVLGENLWPQDACHELIARANLAGGEDNIGVVIVSLPSAEGAGQ